MNAGLSELLSTIECVALRATLSLNFLHTLYRFSRREWLAASPAESPVRLSGKIGTMKREIDYYHRCLLAMLAVCLVWLVAGMLTSSPSVNAQNASATLNYGPGRFQLFWDPTSHWVLRIDTATGDTCRRMNGDSDSDKSWWDYWTKLDEKATAHSYSDDARALRNPPTK